MKDIITYLTEAVLRDKQDITQQSDSDIIIAGLCKIFEWDGPEVEIKLISPGCVDITNTSYPYAKAEAEGVDSKDFARLGITKLIFHNFDFISIDQPNGKGVWDGVDIELDIANIRLGQSLVKNCEIKSLQRIEIYCYKGGDVKFQNVEVETHTFKIQNGVLDLKGSKLKCHKFYIDEYISKHAATHYRKLVGQIGEINPLIDLIGGGLDNQCQIIIIERESSGQFANYRLRMVKNKALQKDFGRGWRWVAEKNGWFRIATDEND